MLAASIFLGALTAYYYGLRAGLWTASAALALLTAATFFPPARLPIYGVLALAAIVVQVAGSRRSRPPGTVRAVRWVRTQVAMGRALWSVKRDS